MFTASKLSGLSEQSDKVLKDCVLDQAEEVEVSELQAERIDHS